MDCNFTDIDKRINERLKILGLKQTDLCSKTGLSTTAISQYCTGKRVPDTTSLFKIASVLKTTMEWILIGCYATNEDLGCNGIPLAPDENALIDMYRFIDNNQRENVFDFITMIYEKESGKKESIYWTYFEGNNKKSPEKSDEENHEIA